MKKESYTDEEIIKGIQRQDNDVVVFVYRKNFRSVKYYIEKNSGNSLDAEDLFQEAMLLLYSKVIDGPLELNCSVHTYLFSIVRILWLKQLKFQERRKIVIEDCDNFISNNEGILDTILLIERKVVFLKHYNELTQDCQKIIKYFLNGLSISEITKMMGYNSEQHTKNRRFRCKKTLIEKILHNPYYKELANGTVGENSEIPRW